MNVPSQVTEERKNISFFLQEWELQSPFCCLDALSIGLQKNSVLSEHRYGEQHSSVDTNDTGSCQWIRKTV